VKGCGSPYLTYHHFDPPWHDGHEHAETGMIALCHSHHDKADGGVWTFEQLRGMKQNPYLTGGSVQGQIDWLRSGIALRAGGGDMIDMPVFLNVGGRKIVWVTRDSDGRAMLNLNLRRADGEIVFFMSNNDWLVSGHVHDVEAAPQGRTLRCEDTVNGIDVCLKFCEATADDYRGMVRIPWSVVEGAIHEWPILVATMTAKIVYPRPVTITDTRIILPGGNTMVGCSFASAGVAAIMV